MAALSDQLLVVTILSYLVAMVCHAAEYAFGARSHVGRAATRPVRELATVGAGLGAGAVDEVPAPPPSGGVALAQPEAVSQPGAVSQSQSGVPTVPGVLAQSGLADQSGVLAQSGLADQPGMLAQPGLLARLGVFTRLTATDRGALAGRAAVWVTVLGALVHLATLVTRGIAADRMPWGNMYEFAMSVTFVGITGWLTVLFRRPAVRHLGLFVALAMVLVLGAVGMIAYTPVGPLVPALNSYWFVVHVSAAIIASGVFLLGAVPAVMYLIRSGYDDGRRSFPYTLGRRVPAAELLERLAFRLHAFAFPIWTFGVAAGAIWAEAAWGRYWGWDPKETWAFISWIVYAGYLHARATPSVKRSTATWIAVIGFATMLMNLFGVNMFLTGLHSYADMK